MTPRLITDDVPALVEFLRIVFGATGECRSNAPSEMRIGDSIVMVSDGGGIREKTSAFLYVYVENTDAACSRAVGAGAQILEPPIDTPYGDRRAMVRDPWGNTWQIATLMHR